MAEEIDLQVSPPVNENTDVNSAESSTVQPDLTVTTDVKSTVAQSSTNTDVKPQTVFEAVKASIAAEKAANDASATSSTQEVADSTNKAADDASKAEPSNDEELIKSLDPKSRASSRIRELVSENKVLSTQSQNFEALSNWTKESGLDQQEFVTGLQIMREMKSDPFKAYEMLKPYMEELEHIVGERLPQDIQEKLDTGLMDEETAKELVAARNRNAIFENNQQVNSERQEQSYQAEQKQRFVANIQSSVTNWDMAWKKSDPDYDKKLPIVLAMASQIRSVEGYPDSVEVALDQVKRARENAEKHLKGIMPNRPNVQTVTGGGSPKVNSAPKTSLEAAKFALQNQPANY